MRAMYAPQAAFLSELFGTRVRYSGASLGAQLASVFAGGLAPFIGTACSRPATAAVRCALCHRHGGGHHRGCLHRGRDLTRRQRLNIVGSMITRYRWR